MKTIASVRDPQINQEWVISQTGAAAPHVPHTFALFLKLPLGFSHNSNIVLQIFRLTSFSRDFYAFLSFDVFDILNPYSWLSKIFGSHGLRLIQLTRK